MRRTAAGRATTGSTAAAAAVLLMLLTGVAPAAPLLQGPNGPIHVAADSIPEPLTREAADPARGREIFLDTERGHCLRCHRAAALDAPFQGTVGPDLDTVGERLTAAQLRLRLVDMSLLNPETVMPPYHRVHDLHQVAEPYRGKPVLAAREIEDLIAFLLTLESNDD